MLDIEPGEGRSLAFQALVQLIALATTLVVAIVSGLLVGLFISFEKIFEPVPDDELFDDDPFWNMADHDNVGFQHPIALRKKSRSRSLRNDTNDLASIASVAMTKDGHLNAGFNP